MARSASPWLLFYSLRALSLLAVATSEGYGIGSLPLPPGNLTQQPSPDRKDGQTSRSVGEYTQEQSIHVSRLEPIRFCAHPELYLTEASATCIPQDLYETSDGYQIRLSRSYSSFRPFYTHLRNLVVGTALRKQISVPEDTAEEWSKLLENIDLEGHSLQSFAKALFSESIDGGCAGIFVEYPEAEEGLTLQQERERAYRPYFVLIGSREILGWTSEVTQTTLGDETVYGRRLTSLRLKTETREVDPSDEFNEIILDAVHVYDFDGSDERVRFRQFVITKDKSTSEEVYVLNKGPSYLSISVIPFVPTYGGVREGFMLARPMLLDVARLNLHHWSITADLVNQLHITSNPKFVITGAQGNGGEMEIPADQALLLDKPDAKAQYIGAPMDGADTTMNYLVTLEEAMEKLAAVALTAKQSTQPESGFSKLLDRAQSDSMLAVLVQGLEESINMAIDIASEYWGAGDGPDVVLSRDFVPVRLHSQQILAYVELFNAKVLSRELFMKILEVGDIFDGIPEFKLEDELAKVEKEVEEERKAQEAMDRAKASGNGRPDTTRIEGSRPRQTPESGREPREAMRTSTAGS